MWCKKKKRNEKNKHGLQIKKLRMEELILKTMFSINEMNEGSKDENDDGQHFYLNLVKQLASSVSQQKTTKHALYRATFQVPTSFSTSSQNQTNAPINKSY